MGSGLTVNHRSIVDICDEFGQYGFGLHYLVSLSNEWSNEWLYT